MTHDDFLSINLIRSHCKLDDVLGVTDEQIELYRSASFDAAERYIGRILFSQRTIEQPIISPKFRGISQVGSARIRVELDYVPIDGIVDISGMESRVLFWFVGMTAPQYTNKTIILPPGIQFFDVTNDLVSMNFGTCDNDLGNQNTVYQQGGLVATYKAGVKCKEDVPAGVKIGCLKYIAWNVQHPGDELVPVVSQGKTQGIRMGLVEGSNDAAYASGAIDEWRRYRRNIAR